MFGVLIRAAEADAIASRTRSVEMRMGGHSLLHPYFPLKVEGETFSSKPVRSRSPMRPASSSRSIIGCPYVGVMLSSEAYISEALLAALVVSRLSPS